MLHNTSAIVLSRMNYSESGLIVRVYTEKFGLISILQKGIRSKKNKKTSLYQPFMILDLVVNLNEKKDLHFAKEASRKYNLREVHTHVIKTSLAFFIAELVYKTINNREENIELYQFLEKSIQFLDTSQESVVNFHLIFMLKYASILGFGIVNGSNNHLYFDLEKGVFEKTPTHSKFLNEEMSKILAQLIKANYLNMNELDITNLQRKQMVESLLDFFYFHNEGLREIKSKKVLETIFR